MAISAASSDRVTFGCAVELGGTQQQDHRLDGHVVGHRCAHVALSDAGNIARDSERACLPCCSTSLRRHRAQDIRGTRSGITGYDCPDVVLRGPFARLRPDSSTMGTPQEKVAQLILTSGIIVLLCVHGDCDRRGILVVKVRRDVAFELPHPGQGGRSPPLVCCNRVAVGLHDRQMSPSERLHGLVFEPSQLVRSPDHQSTSMMRAFPDKYPDRGILASGAPTGGSTHGTPGSPRSVVTCLAFRLRAES